MLRIHDTAVGGLVDFVPREPGRVAIYVCGPTVYDVPHIGHGRYSLVFDVLRRYLEWCGNDVVYVSNVTDIDDKIINRANQEGRSTDEVVAQYEALWFEVMDRLGVKRPTADPHATAYVDRMIELIGELERAGIAYAAPDGVYFGVEAVADYGLLARQALDTLRAGARVEVDAAKRSAFDFVLWKASKPGEPSWDSPWGPGRPGWHTECVVMSLDLLGEGFDLHGGGQDLAFPHHENERAQAVAAGRTFSRYWMHNGMVEVAGEKMSKSLGNFTTLVDLLDRADPRAYRLLVLQAHYRSPIEVTEDTVGQSVRTLGTLDALVRRSAGLPPAEPDADALSRFRDRMDDDLDTPGAMAVLFDTARRANTALDADDAATAASLLATIHEMATAVGLPLEHAEEGFDADVLALVERREAARAARDFAAADAIRDELAARGLAVEDTPGGARLHRVDRP